MKTDSDPQRNIQAFTSVLTANDFAEGAETTDIIRVAKLLLDAIKSCNGQMSMHWLATNGTDRSHDRLNGLEVNGEYLALFRDYVSLSEDAVASALLYPPGEHPPTYVVSSGLQFKFSKAISLGVAVLLESHAFPPLNELDSDELLCVQEETGYQRVIVRSKLGVLTTDRMVVLRLSSGKAALVAPNGLRISSRDVMRILG